ncbi:VanZ family protein [Methylomonas sp. MS20]|uniref:VanZ family protein n=1 Tax=unclassified Methylomonas TaxID=2608980 RepID=UPI0028A4CB23|nr:VanZ family protein [Methylomonas sp. MV1]MDT4330080.1 VanZ family protein [Methylomonas sp. MV1]
MQLSATLKVENVVKGPLDWEIARIVLVAYDHSGKPRYDRPHVLASLFGTSDWTQHQRVFQVSPDTTSLQVSAQLVHSRGRFLVTGLNLHAVQLNPEFARYRSVLFAAWLALGFWIGWPFVMNRLNTPSNRLVLLATFGILAGVLMPESLKEILGETLWPAAALAPHGDHAEFVQTFNLDFSIPIIDIYKLGHFTMFALLAWAIGASNRFRPISASRFFLMSLFATSSEILQLFIPSRGPQLGDIFIDCIGIVFGLAISALCGLLFYRRGNI